MRPALLAALAALALLAGCDDGDGSGLVFKDPKGTVEVEKGMTFSLEFSVNAGVGYEWEQVGPATGPLEARGTDVHYERPDAAGDSGTKRFEYEATEAGTGRLTFRKLYRGDPQERRAVTVRIRGG